MTTWRRAAIAIRNSAGRRVLAAAETRLDPADLMNAAIDALIRERCELLSLSTLLRLAGNAHRRINSSQWQQVIAPTSTLLFLEEFDSIVAVADELYVVDGDRITSFGGTGAALAAAYLVERHLDAGSAQKAFASCRSIGLVRRRLSNQRRRSPCRAMTSALHGRFS